MTIGQRLKKHRLERGLTQEELGKVVGVTKGAIQKYECGQIKNFSASSIRKLSEFFGLAPIYFIFDEIPEASKDITKLCTMHFGTWFLDLAEKMNRLTDEGKRKVYDYCVDIALIDKYNKEKTPN